MRSGLLTAAAPSIFAYYRYFMDDVVASGDDDNYVPAEPRNPPRRTRRCRTGAG
jgi:hypothetical protein